MNTTTRLTIPMDKELRDNLSLKAKTLGFDSSQALLRYVSKAITDGRSITFGEDQWSEPPEVVLRQWQSEASDLTRQLNTGEAKSFNNADDLMADLRS